MRSIRTAIAGLLALTLLPGLAAAQSSPSVKDLAVTGILSAPQLPGLSSNVQGTANVGLNLPCTGQPDCGFFIYARPAGYPAAADAQLRVQREAPDAGGVSGNTYAGSWTICTTGAHDLGFQWCNKSELHNRSLASLSPVPQNVAVSGTVFKELNGRPAGTMIGPSWAGYFECQDTTRVVNPIASCIGAEIDSFAAAGSGTDSNRQRVGLQISAGAVQHDEGVHIGYALLMGAANGATVDNAIGFRDANQIETFNVKGSGDTLIRSTKPSWSSIGISPSLVVTSLNSQANPAIGLFDLNNGNGFAIANLAGEINFLKMPALDSRTAPVILGTMTMANGNFGMAGNINAAHFSAANRPGVNCSGPPTTGFATVGGIVTHC